MSSEEHRYHTRLTKYWDTARAERLFPAENDINPDDLLDIWDSCFLISIDDVTHRVGYRYSYMGQDLVNAYGDEGVGNALISASTSPMVIKFNEVMKDKKPVIDESEFVNAKHLQIRYRSCILPLGTSDGAITHLLGCMRWKMY